MAPTLHLVRHAQGYHNLNTANHAMHDPPLTPIGEQQCRDLASTFPFHDGVEAVVASPLRRTVYTALLGFGQDLEKRGLRVIGLPELQETSEMPCDTGSTPQELAKEFEGKRVDLGLVKEGWTSKKGKWAPSGKAIEARAKEARVWFMNRPEKEIVVVTHGDFLHFFTEDWADCNRFNGTGWANTEYRSYNFSTHEPAEAHLVETEESKKRRSATVKPLDREEKAQILPAVTASTSEMTAQDPTVGVRANI